MERDEIISVIKVEKPEKCGTCVSRFTSGYCPIANTHVHKDDEPKDYECREYLVKKETD